MSFGRFDKYLYTLSLGVQNTLVYRTNFLLRAIFNLLPLLAIITLWRTIYTDKANSIAGYDLTQMVSYYLIVTLVDVLTSVTEDDWQIAADIKDGQISQFVIRPIDYLSYRLCLFFSGRFVFTLASALPVLVFLFCQRDSFLLPVDAGSLGVFGFSLVLSALLQFYFSFALSMLAFWVLEVSSFVFALLAAQRLFGGQMFPLDILPSPLAACLMYTPFAYQTFFPASIYLGRVHGDALLTGLAIQCAWVLTAALLARLCWRRGLQSYTGVGS